MRNNYDEKFDQNRKKNMNEEKCGKIKIKMPRN